MSGDQKTVEVATNGKDEGGRLFRDRIKELRRVKSSELIADEANWRKHPARQELAMRSVLQEIGYADALIARETDDGKLKLIDGHLRKSVTPDQEVPVLILDVNEDEARQIMLTLDPITGMATPDKAKLRAVMDRVSCSDDGMKDLISRIAKENRVDVPEWLKKKVAADQDDVPDPATDAKTVDIVHGDILVMDGHRLMCGDSTNAEDISRLMNGEKASLLSTDPPYLVDYTGDRPNDSGKDWSENYREVDIPDADKFFDAVFRNALPVINPNTAIYCWHAHKRTGNIQRIWDGLEIVDHQQIIWVKPTPVFGRVYWHFRHEPCMMGWAKGSKPDHNGSHDHDSVWEIDWEGKSRIIGNEHPTQKPVEIFRRPMEKHTQPGDICLEPFSGSGSQLVAAEQLGRRCYAMEISPVFVDVAVRRWERLTGKTAVRERLG